MKNIKIIFLLVMLSVFATTTAQDRPQKFAVSVFSDPYATYKDGPNVGVAAEYQMKLMYFKAQLFIFPDLNGATYREVSGVPIGFNYHSFWSEYRIYGGVKLGFIYRQGLHLLVGLESGLDINITNTTFLGLMTSYDYRSDGKIFSINAKPYMRLSGFVKIGFRF